MHPVSLASPDLADQRLIHGEKLGKLSAGFVLSQDLINLLIRQLASHLGTRSQFQQPSRMQVRNLACHDGHMLNLTADFNVKRANALGIAA